MNTKCAAYKSEMCVQNLSTIFPNWVQIHHLLVLRLLVAIPWIVPSQWRVGSRAQRRSHPGQRCQSSESDPVVSALQPSVLGSCRSGYQPRCCKTDPLAWLQGVSGLHETTVNQNYQELRVCTYVLSYMVHQPQWPDQSLQLSSCSHPHERRRCWKASGHGGLAPFYEYRQLLPGSWGEEKTYDNGQTEKSDLAIQ